MSEEENKPSSTDTPGAWRRLRSGPAWTKAVLLLVVLGLITVGTFAAFGGGGGGGDSATTEQPTAATEDPDAEVPGDANSESSDDESETRDPNNPNAAAEIWLEAEGVKEFESANHPGLPGEPILGAVCIDDFEEGQHVCELTLSSDDNPDQPFVIEDWLVTVDGNRISGERKTEFSIKRWLRNDVKRDCIKRYQESGGDPMPLLDC